MSTPSMDNNGLRKGAWSPEEGQKLIAYITRYRIWNWNLMPKYAGLARTGKSCRLRWVNYLNPQIKRGNITKEEEDIIMNMYTRLGKIWSTIARRLPGRTDNEIKNYWHTHLKKHFKETIVPKDIDDMHNFVVADEESSNKSKVMTIDSALEASNVERSSTECSSSISGSSIEGNVVYNLDEMRSISFEPNGDLQSLWSQSLTNENLSMTNEEESYIQGWYPKPSSPYSLCDYEHCYGHLLGEDIEGTWNLSI